MLTAGRFCIKSSGALLSEPLQFGLFLTVCLISDMIIIIALIRMAATVYACAEQVRTRFSLYLTTVSSRTCSAKPLCSADLHADCQTDIR